MSKVYRLHPAAEVQCRRQMHIIKDTFTAELLDFFLLAMDTSTRMGRNTPEGLQTMQRAYELLLEARHGFEQEFD